MWDLPGLGIEPAFPALAGGFLTTGPPEKSTTVFELLSGDLLFFFLKKQICGLKIACEVIHT